VKRSCALHLHPYEGHERRVCVGIFSHEAVSFHSSLLPIERNGTLYTLLLSVMCVPHKDTAYLYGTRLMEYGT
jgi:hypothetical protein